MGFRNGAYATVWSVEKSQTGTTTKVRISCQKKNKQTGEYEQDFSGFCTFIGAANEKAGQLVERDRIKIGDCDVSTFYSKEKKVEYVTYKVFDFEMASGTAGNNTNSTTKKPIDEEVEPEVSEDDANCPF